MGSRKKIIRVNSTSFSMEAFLREQVLHFSQWYDIICVSSPGPEHASMRAVGICTKEIFIARPISLWQDLCSLWKLYRFFRQERPDIVHSLTPKAGLLSMAAAWLARVPVRIHTFTGLLFPWKTGLLKHVLMATDRLTCLFATHINPEGQGVRDQLRQGRITWKPLTVLGYGNIHGVNMETYRRHGSRSSVREQLGIAPTSFVLAFTGRLVRDKGINELVEAFCQLAPSYQQLELLLIGNEEEQLDPLLPKTQEALQSHPRIHAVGYRRDIPALLEAADAFVFPSYREGFPNALLEAMAMELPCIATNICGCNEIVDDGLTGFLIPPRDTHALQQAIVRLLDMSSFQRLQVGHDARARVQQRFSFSFVSRELFLFYEAIA